MAADRAEQHGVPMPQPMPEVRAVLESRIPEFGSSRNPCDVTAQILSDPESLGACATALLSDPQYGVLVSPLTYGYAPSAKRPQVYSDAGGASRQDGLRRLADGMAGRAGRGRGEPVRAGWRCSAR